MATVDSIDRYFGLDADQFTPTMAEAVLSFQCTDDVKQRVTELADKANLGTITPEERAEYERYIQLDELVAVMKARARRFLSSKSQ